MTAKVLVSDKLSESGLNVLKAASDIEVDYRPGLSEQELADIIGEYGHVEEIIWCQEEPLNQGAWYQIKHRLQEPLAEHQQLYYAGRPGAAAPASGIFKVHLQQQQALVEAALDISSEAEKVRKPEKTKRKTK